MLEQILQNFVEGHHIVFFISGVVVAGIISGLCSFYKARSAMKGVVVKLKM